MPSIEINYLKRQYVSSKKKQTFSIHQSFVDFDIINENHDENGSRWRYFIDLWIHSKYSFQWNWGSVPQHLHCDVINKYKIQNKNITCSATKTHFPSEHLTRPVNSLICDFCFLLAVSPYGRLSSTGPNARNRWLASCRNCQHKRRWGHENILCSLCRLWVDV